MDNFAMLFLLLSEIVIIICAIWIIIYLVYRCRRARPHLEDLQDIICINTRIPCIMTTLPPQSVYTSHLSYTRYTLDYTYFDWHNV